jgi:hypothetical protein
MPAFAWSSLQAVEILPSGISPQASFPVGYRSSRPISRAAPHVPDRHVPSVMSASLGLGTADTEHRPRLGRQAGIAKASACLERVYEDQHTVDTDGDTRRAIRGGSNPEKGADQPDCCQRRREPPTRHGELCPAHGSWCEEWPHERPCSRQPMSRWSPDASPATAMTGSSADAICAGRQGRLRSFGRRGACQAV